MVEFAGPDQSDPGAGWIPADAHGAAGPNHFVAVVNQHLSVYDKATTTRVLSLSLQSFFGGSASILKGSPRVAYDHHAARWVLIATDFASGIHFAWSTSDDPTGSWYKTFIVLAEDEDAGTWPEYPTLGLDVEGIYVGAHMVGNELSLFAIDKGPLLPLVPSIVTVTAWRSLNGNGALQPCLTYGTPPGCYVTSRVDGDTLRIRRIDPPLDGPTLTSLGTVQTKVGNAPPSAPALGSSVNLDTLDARHMNSVYRNGSIWLAHCVARNMRPAINWYEIDPVALAVVQEGTLKSDVDSYCYPTIAVNSAGDAVLGFSAASPAMYAGAWYTGRRSTDLPGEMAAPVPYQAGSGPYNQLASGVNRWGSYSMTAVDPSDDLGFWTIQELALANGTWGTHIAELDFACSAPLASPPADAAHCPGESASFATTASGTGPFTYQWQKDGADIPGATAASHAIASVAPADAGRTPASSATPAARSPRAGRPDGPRALGASIRAARAPAATAVAFSTSAAAAAPSPTSGARTAPPSRCTGATDASLPGGRRRGHLRRRRHRRLQLAYHRLRGPGGPRSAERLRPERRERLPGGPPSPFDQRQRQRPALLPMAQGRHRHPGRHGDASDRFRAAGDAASNTSSSPAPAARSPPPPRPWWSSPRRAPPTPQPARALAPEPPRLLDSASGSGPLSYQWRKDGAVIARRHRRHVRDHGRRGRRRGGLRRRRHRRLWFAGDERRRARGGRARDGHRSRWPDALPGLPAVLDHGRRHGPAPTSGARRGGPGRREPELYAIAAVASGHAGDYWSRSAAPAARSRPPRRRWHPRRARGQLLHGGHVGRAAARRCSPPAAREREPASGFVVHEGGRGLDGPDPSTAARTAPRPLGGNGTSFKCVVPPAYRARRLPATSTSNLCNATLGDNLNVQWQAKPHHNPGAEALVQIQLWYRDPHSTSNQNTAPSSTRWETPAPAGRGHRTGPLPVAADRSAPLTFACAAWRDRAAPAILSGPSRSIPGA